MLGFWNSYETFSTASTVIGFIAAVLGILLFIVERRETTLERQSAAPRDLSEIQTRTLLESLERGPKGPIHINFPSGDAEAQRYAKQFRAIFEKAGFPVEIFSFFIGGVRATQFWITNHGDGPPPDYSKTIEAAFQEAGFSIETENIKSGKPWVAVAIGAKPTTLLE
jgi:hypothetical protein